MMYRNQAIPAPKRPKLTFLFSLPIIQLLSGPSVIILKPSSRLSLEAHSSLAAHLEVDVRPKIMSHD